MDRQPESTHAGAARWAANPWLREFAVVGTSYAAGVGALLLWPDRQRADQTTLLVVALAIAIGGTFALHLALFREPPGLYRSERPRRYQIPYVLGLLAAFAWATWVRASEAPDRALEVFAGVVPLLVAGQVVSSLWWTISRRRGRPPG